MVCNWPIVRLGDHCRKIGSGATPRGGKSTYLEAGPFTLIRSQNVYNDRFSSGGLAYISEEQARALDGVAVEENDVLVNITGDSVARVCLAPSWALPARVNQHVAIVRPESTSFDSRFLRYQLVSPFQQERLLGLAAVGATRNALTKGMLESFELPMPPLQIQRHIAETLAALDDRIDLLRQTNTTLEAIAQALFKSWFVDFDPVHAKAEGRKPEAMDAATAALFPGEFEESELGVIPKGWRVDEIGNAVKCLGGATPSTKEDAYWADDEHHWVTPKDLASLQAPVLTDTSRRITDAGLSRISSGLLPRGTLLMSSRAPIGYLALAGIPTAINQGFIAMLPGGTLSPIYLFFWTRANMDSIKQKANGSTFMEISKSAFRPIKLCVPPPELVDAFVALASPLMDRIEANEHHRVALTELRDTLLPRLISGKLRLPDIAEAREAALA